MAKQFHSRPADAITDIADGATILIGGFGDAGHPLTLLRALCERPLRGLTVVSNNAGFGRTGTARLIMNGSVDRVICSFPFGVGSEVVREAASSGKVHVEVVPQGTLAERLRAGGSGLGGVLTRTGLGTEFALGRRIIDVDGEDFLLEPPLRGDVALIAAHDGDRAGNLRYRHAAHNFNTVMAMAASLTIAEVRNLHEQPLEPSSVHTPGIFVDRLVRAGDAVADPT